MVGYTWEVDVVDTEAEIRAGEDNGRHRRGLVRSVSDDEQPDLSTRRIRPILGYGQVSAAGLASCGRQHAPRTSDGSEGGGVARA